MISPIQIFIAIFAIIATTASAFIVFSDFFVELAGSHEIKKHRNNNAKLIQTIEENEIRIDALTKTMDEIKMQDNQIRRLVKLPAIHDDIRQMGVGGMKQKDNSDNLEYLIPENEFDLKKLNKRLDKLHRSINLATLSYSEIFKKADSETASIRAYPAIHPINLDDTRKSSGYGFRRDPFSNKFKFHDGHDFSAKTGTPVYATADGRVRISRYYSTFGNYIEIDHSNGYRTIYGHLSKRQVKAGDKVIRGQRIGSVGNTGRSTAPHLHYEVQYNKKTRDPKNYYFDLSSTN